MRQGDQFVDMRVYVQSRPVLVWFSTETDSFLYNSMGSDGKL